MVDPNEVPTEPAVVTHDSPSVSEAHGHDVLDDQVAGSEQRGDAQAGQDLHDAEDQEIAHHHAEHHIADGEQRQEHDHMPQRLFISEPKMIAPGAARTTWRAGCRGRLAPRFIAVDASKCGGAMLGPRTGPAAAECPGTSVHCAAWRNRAGADDAAGNRCLRGRASVRHGLRPSGVREPADR